MRRSSSREISMCTLSVYLVCIILASLVEKSNSFHHLIHFQTSRTLSPSPESLNQFKYKYVYERKKSSFNTKLYVSELEKIEKTEETTQILTKKRLADTVDSNDNSISLKALDSFTYGAGLLQKWEKN